MSGLIWYCNPAFLFISDFFAKWKILDIQFPEQPDIWLGNQYPVHCSFVFLAVIFRHLNSEGFSVQGNCSAHFVPVSSVVEPFYFGPAPAPASQDGGSNSSSSCSCSPQFIVLKNLKNNFFNLPGLVLFTERHECFALLFQYFTLLKGTDKFYFTLLKFFVCFFLFF